MQMSYPHILWLLRGNVTFGDGVKGSIKGKGYLESDDQPALENVYCVEDLTANLIQLYEKSSSLKLNVKP